MIDTDVAIVGAGPVGLTAALALARRGFTVRVYERGQKPFKYRRASTFHSPSLDVAFDLGIVGDMLDQGLIASIHQVRDHREGVLARLDFNLLADETAWPFRLQLEEYKYSAIVLSALQRLPGVDLVRGVSVTGLRQLEEHVELELGGTASTTSRWVIGADGAGSMIRQLAGINFDGDMSPSRRLLLSTEEPLDELVTDLDAVNYVYAPIDVGMVLRTPDVWQVLLNIPDDVGDEQARSGEYFAPRLDALLDVVPEVETTQIYYVHHKIASTFRRGRVFLIGDAARANAASGRWGMNSGIHDAFDLASTLGTAGRDKALDAWARRRREAAVDDIHRNLEWYRIEFAETDPATRARWQQVVCALATDQQKAREWLLDSSMITNVRQYPIGVGRVAPYSQEIKVVAKEGAVL